MHDARVAQLILGLLAGVGVGAAFFGGLRANTELYFKSLATAVALHIGRFALVTAAFLALAVLAPQGLLTALGGFTMVGLVLGGRAARATP